MASMAMLNNQRVSVSGWWLSPTPLKNMSSSVGMMKFPTEWKNKIHVPNHQPGLRTGKSPPE
jgi:hypothetical protein